MDPRERARKITKDSTNLKAKAVQEAELERRKQARREEEELANRIAHAEYINEGTAFLKSGIKKIFEELVRTGKAIEVSYGEWDYMWGGGCPTAMLTLSRHSVEVLEDNLQTTAGIMDVGVVATIVPSELDFRHSEIAPDYNQGIKMKRDNSKKDWGRFARGKYIPKGIHINGKLVGEDGSVDDLIAQGLANPIPGV